MLSGCNCMQIRIDTVPGSRGGVNSGGADGPEGSVGGCHSGGAFGITAAGLLLLSTRRLPSCWAESELLDRFAPQLPPKLAANRCASLKAGKFGRDADAFLLLLPDRGRVVAEPALQGNRLNRLL